MTRTETVERTVAHVGLLDWLQRNDIDHQLHEHALTFTARETARVEGVDPTRFAKVVGVLTSDGRQALLVVDATDRVDLVKARHVLNSGNVRLMSEDELLALAPDCAVGTIPPVGTLFGVAVYADHAVHEDREVTFHAGSHRHTVRVDRRAWERAANVIYGDLAVAREGVPAWAMS